MHMSMMQRRNPVLTDGVFLTPMSVSRMKSVKKNATGCFENRRNHNHWTAVLCMVSKSDRRKPEKKTVHSEKLVFNLLCITLYKASRLKSLFGDYDMEGTEVADVAPFRLCNQFLSRYVSMIYYSNDKIEN